jgi:hypothetical protein
LAAQIMMPLFVYPLAFLGLVAIPTLLAIYWLRSRFRRYTVSSLLLWRDPRDPRMGGTRIHRLQTPLLLFLELVAILLLVLAAAEPRVPLRSATHPLVVILDDSFSMRAGGSSRQRARAALEQELREHPHASYRFVLAGDSPVLLGETVYSVPEALHLLDGWPCQAPAAHLQEALTLGAELGGPLCRLLVLTDHAPEGLDVPQKGRIQWWSFGRATANHAFVNAARTSRDGSDRCLLEIANLSDEPHTTALRIEAGSPPALLQRKSVTFQPRQTQRIILQLKEDTPALHAHLDDDELDLDNEVTLLPVVERPLRVDVQIRDEPLHELIDRGVRSIREARRTSERPDLLFTDQMEVETGPGTWVLSLLAEKEAQSYSGPFVLDHTHPLAEGLSLQGVIWGAGKGKKLPGAPVVLAGNVPLLTDHELPGQQHHLYLRLRQDLSTLPDTPAWPVLLWNLVHWRIQHRPGLSRHNLRLGEEAIWTLAGDRDTVTVRSPSGVRQSLPVQERRVVIRGNEPGTYILGEGEERAELAVNTLSREESDLTRCATGTWGSWLDEATLQRDYQSVAWVFLLLALGVATVHLLIVARQRGRRRL